MSESSLDWRRELTDLIPRLRRYALALTRSADLADDMLQSTLERALQKRHLYQAGTNLEGWLFRICKNLWIDELRKKKFEAGPVDPEIAERSMIFDGEKQLAERALLSEVNAVMAQLTGDQRAVLLVVGVEGHSYAEAAEILEIPVGTVMSRLARARRSLSERIYPGKREETEARPETRGEEQ